MRVGLRPFDAANWLCGGKKQPPTSFNLFTEMTLLVLVSCLLFINVTILFIMYKLKNDLLSN